MKTALITLTALTLATAAHAAPLLPLRGSCHANVMDSNGSIVRQTDVTLTQIDPSQRYGLALAGDIEGAHVIVDLAVGNYDKIGFHKTDKVFMTIARDGADSTSEVSGRALAEGDELHGDLSAQSIEVDCVAQLNQ